MNNEVLHTICDTWNLGDVKTTQAVDEGVLNENYIIETNKGKFFIKSVRDKKQLSVPYIYSVEKYMHEKSIPSIVMLKNKHDDISLVIHDVMITVYPYIENIPRVEYSIQDYYAYGETLGKIHLAGSEITYQNLCIKELVIPDSDNTSEQLEKYRELIANKPTKTVEDILFIQYLELKINNLKTYPKPKISYTSSILHGDYHIRNILFGNDGEIVGVCDWEKTMRGPKMYELMRSILYGQLQYRNSDTPEIETSYIAGIEASIRGYASVQPFSYEEILSGYDILAYGLNLHTWMEKMHYDQKNSRANIFLNAQIHHIQTMNNTNLRSIIGELAKKYSAS